MQRATRISKRANPASVAIAALLMLSAPAAAQVAEEEPDAVDVARTPLEDFNIDSDDIPEVLTSAARDPYASEGLTVCNDLVREIAALDQVLGADFDLARDEEGGMSTGRIARSVVGSFIPFRGIVREVSGANAKEREFRTAVSAGMVRRAYLKGLGQARRCDYPARPRADRAASQNAE